MSKGIADDLKNKIKKKADEDFKGYLKVGYPDEAKEKGGGEKKLRDIAHDLNSGHTDMVAKPYLDDTFTQEIIKKHLKKLIKNVKNGATLKQALNIMGQNIAQVEIPNTIKTHQYFLTPKTWKEKLKRGKNIPLIDTGTLIAGASWEIG